MTAVTELHPLDFFFISQLLLNSCVLVLKNLDFMLNASIKFAALVFLMMRILN